MGINGKLLDVITLYHKNRQQYVSLSGASSSLISIKAGVPQGSVCPGRFILIILR